MVKPRQELIGAITELDRNHTGTVNVNNAKLQNISGLIVAGTGSIPSTGDGYGAFWVDNSGPLNLPKYTYNNGVTITIGESASWAELLAADPNTDGYNPVISYGSSLTFERYDDGTYTNHDILQISNTVNGAITTINSPSREESDVSVDIGNMGYGFVPNLSASLVKLNYDNGTFGTTVFASNGLGYSTNTGGAFIIKTDTVLDAGSQTNLILESSGFTTDGGGARITLDGESPPSAGCGSADIILRAGNSSDGYNGVPGYVLTYGGNAVEGSTSIVAGGVTLTGGTSYTGNGIVNNCGGGWVGITGGSQEGASSGDPSDPYGYAGGNVWIAGGRAYYNGRGGPAEVRGGQANTGHGGYVRLAGGSSTLANGGDIYIDTGTSTAGASYDGYVIIRQREGNVYWPRTGKSAGKSLVLGSDGEHLIWQSNDGYFDGDFEITGKLTVAGLIDPTGMVLDTQSSVPGGQPASGKATLWVRQSDGYAILTNSSGIDTILSGGGGSPGTVGITLQSINNSTVLSDPGGAELVVFVDTSHVNWSVGESVILPASVTTGSKITIKDSGGSGATKTIVVNGNGYNIDGDSLYTLNLNYSSISLIFSGADWFVI